MNFPDPFELFRDLEPPIDEEDASRRDDEVLANVMRAVSLPQSKRPWPRWMIMGGIGAVAVTTAAFAVLRSEPASEPTALVCLASPDPLGDAVGLGAAENVVEACRELWRNGTLGSGSVPPLTACVNEAGAPVVFPAVGTICNRVGMPTLEPSLTDEQRAIVLIQEQLVAAFLNECFEERAAVEQAHRLLDEFGVVGWTVDVPEPFPPGAECAVLGVDNSAKTLIVVGSRPR